MSPEKQTAFIFHGSYGYPEENWFPWLKSELEILGLQVFVPQFPIPAEPDPAYGGHSLSEWLATFDQYKNYVNQNTTIIAHSRGCIFTYRVLEKMNQPIKAVFLVAPWINYRWYPKGWNKIDSFHETPFDWKKTKSGSRYFEIYQSTNDDTPVTEGKDIADNLKGKIIVVANAGHFNTKAGYKKFPLLLENIKKHLK